MKTVLNIKTDPAVKKAAQRVAKSMGVPLSTIVNAQLKQLINERRVVLRASEVPNAKTAKELDKAREDFKKGRNVSPGFDNIEDALAWLHAADPA
ncbi:MAG: type II toxin-antitoxin system RelB/DinJ family antitoxin [Patescibacteria group bacterium]|nr:type II toxin-antitoxin system RelB/DinJ family antitoxin [Patescibacteria group bacterium]MDE1944154.1 type II toxin-antitoxin system RelB/DinJ family antitoxin [Patescibacteria group bacterium]MDE1945437.1 type II toxin-antitoxin system RelB/DinJ family antitoxin [Patescibacteria group bacterium]MDE2057954.1 type II toxin-antitoxin system RelB/DinJ family antitoxin [Patescibacteria group bacterium]